MTDDDWRAYEREVWKCAIEQHIEKHCVPPPETEPEPEPESPAVETTLAVVPATSAPTPTALPPVSLINITPSLLPLGNLKTPQAVEKMARQRTVLGSTSDGG